jgi:hypothetical protein
MAGAVGPGLGSGDGKALSKELVGTASASDGAGLASADEMATPKLGNAWGRATTAASTTPRMTAVPWVTTGRWRGSNGVPFQE